MVHIGLDLVQQVHALAPQGVSHIVDVAFGANIAADVDMLDVRGSIATYATNVDAPAIPFWLLLFKNIGIDFLGGDDFAPADKEEAARATTEALLSGAGGLVRGISRDSSSNASVIKMLASTGEFESLADHSHDGGPDGVERDRAR